MSLRPLSNKIPEIASLAFSKKHLMLGRLLTQWEGIVGSDLAGKTQPVRLRYVKPKKESKSKATASLDICASTADATLLHYRKDLILERINQLFGDRWVTAIRFVPKETEEQDFRPRKTRKPLTEKDNNTIKNALSGVSDPELQEQLARLGKAVLQDQA